MVSAHPKRSLSRFALEWGLVLYGASLGLNYGTDKFLKTFGDVTAQEIRYNGPFGKTLSCEFRKLVVEPTNETVTPIDSAYPMDKSSVSPFNPGYSLAKVMIYLDNSENFSEYQKRRGLNEDCGCGKILQPPGPSQGILVA